MLYGLSPARRPPPPPWCLDAVVIKRDQSALEKWLTPGLGKRWQTSWQCCRSGGPAHRPVCKCEPSVWAPATATLQKPPAHSSARPDRNASPWLLGAREHLPEVSGISPPRAHFFGWQRLVWRRGTSPRLGAHTPHFHTLTHLFPHFFSYCSKGPKIH